MQTHLQNQGHPLELIISIQLLTFSSKMGVSIVSAPCFLNTDMILLRTEDLTAICSGEKSLVPFGVLRMNF